MQKTPLAGQRESPAIRAFLRQKRFAFPARQRRQDLVLAGDDLPQLVLGLAIKLEGVARLYLLHVEPVKLAAL
jgi:hypothetical protein